MTLAQTLARNIRREREAAGMSRADLGRKAGFSEKGNFIESVENGRRTPSIANVERIARALDIRPSSLLFGEDEV